MSKLYFRYGAMNAAKSAQLLTAAHNYEELGKNALLYNFDGDVRYGEGVIASRLGVSKPCRSFNNDTDFEVDVVIEFYRKHYHAIFVDEAQFLTKDQVRQLHDIATDFGIPVMCYGLRTDFQGNLFEGSQALMAHAETLEEIKTICKCGKKATHVARYVDGVKQTEGDQMVIGDSEYISQCYKCWVSE